MKHVAVALTIVLAACNSSKVSGNGPVQAKAEPGAVSAVASAASVAEPVAASEAGQLTLVTESSKVCMVNNQFMGREQIPIEVDGRTYFGCCEMCKGRLARDPSARNAKDPVSGKVVDKASAVIAKRPNGEVLYFESRESFQRYRAL